MKILKNLLLFTIAFGDDGSGDFSVTGRSFDIANKMGLVDELLEKNPGSEPEMIKASKSTQLDLMEPLYQECEAPAICGDNKISARCRHMGESCAQSDPDNSPCDYHCVSECPAGQHSIIVTGDSGGKFKKCVSIAEIRQMSNFICSSPEGATPQFEMQVPKIIRHKYLTDTRNYTLIPFFDEGVKFESSNCIQSEESEHFVTFKGALEGQGACQINHWIEYEGDALFDVYTATVGYDDLTGEIGVGQTIIYRKGAHYEFECRVKRTGTVTNNMFPFVDGRRPVTIVNDETETEFEMVRCSDSTCAQTQTNGVIDISPDSMDDPLVWFKVSRKIFLA